MTTRISDLADKVRGWFKRTAGGGLLSLSLILTPSPSHRPQVGKYGTYYPAKYTAMTKEAAKQLASLSSERTDGPIACLVEAIVEKPKTGKLEYPRGDVDNYVKGPLDVMTKAEKFWNDDVDIVFLAVTKRYAEPGEPAGYNVHYFPVT